MYYHGNVSNVCGNHLSWEIGRRFGYHGNVHTIHQLKPFFNLYPSWECTHAKKNPPNIATERGSLDSCLWFRRLFAVCILLQRHSSFTVNVYAMTIVSEFYHKPNAQNPLTRVYFRLVFAYNPNAPGCVIA